jgi:hypothetical protein
MSFLVEEYVTLDPVDVCFLSADGVMFDPEHLAHLVKESAFWIGDDLAGASEVIGAKGMQWFLWSTSSSSTFILRLEKNGRPLLYVNYERE